MVSQSLLVLTVTLSVILAVISAAIYHSIEFRTERHERWVIKAGILLLPVYALLEFKILPSSAVPEAILLAVGIGLAYAFRGFHKRAIS